MRIRNIDNKNSWLNEECTTLSYTYNFISTIANSGNVKF